MEALILAGGLGTRLAAVVSDRAKPVAIVGGRPFVAYILAQLETCREVGGVTLCVGHKADTVRAALGGSYGRLPLRYSEEEEPLGTGGALRQAIKSVGLSDALFALNGDSYVGLRLERMLEFHRARRGHVTLALARVQDGLRFGAARIAAEKVVSFREKGMAGPAWINAGIYVLSRSAQQAILDAPRRFSFERGLLAPWSARGLIYGMKARGRFLDIGTPEDYLGAAPRLPKT